MRTLSQIFIITAGLIGTPSLCFSQNEEINPQNYQGWYQIEVIIFQQEVLSENNHSEMPPQQLNISYPPNLVALLEPTEELSTDTTKGSAIDKQATTSLDANVLKPMELSTDQEGTTLSLAQPFLSLEDIDKNLTREARTLSRNSRKRVLFHKAWRQHLERDQSAPSILISGGDNFDPHNELEGSIKFSLSRYLHMESNLWLSQFSLNFIQDKDYWTVLPTPPTPENKITPSVEPSSTSNHSSRAASNLELDTLKALNTHESNPNGTYSANNNSLGISPRLAGSDISPLFTELENVSAPQYTPEHTAIMKQTRRMRSNELHYIDHPKFGLLVKIIPFTEILEARLNNQTTP